MQDWHYELDGQRFGPVSETALQAMIQAGQLKARSLVWSAQQVDWKPVASTPLAVHLPPVTSPPPLPAARIGNAVVWWLAAAPMLGLFLQAFVAGAMVSSQYTADFEVAQALQHGRYWYLSLLLNIGLGVLDWKRLERAGVDTSAFGKLMWLVPVYLWKRARSLQQTPAYFWVWIACFVLAALIPDHM